MKSETKQWLKIAEGDYDVSQYGFKMARYPQALYLLCQAIEKALKGAQIELADQVPKKTHNLKNIGTQTGLPFSKAQYQVLKNLTKHYTRVRYPDYSKASYNTKAKVEPIFIQGKEVYQWILARLNYR